MKIEIFERATPGNIAETIDCEGLDAFRPYFNQRYNRRDFDYRIVERDAPVGISAKPGDLIHFHLRATVSSEQLAALTIAMGKAAAVNGVLSDDLVDIAINRADALIAALTRPAKEIAK